MRMLQCRPAAGAILQLVKGSNIFQSGPYTVLQAEEEGLGVVEVVKVLPPPLSLTASPAPSHFHEIGERGKIWLDIQHSTRKYQNIL